MISIDVILEKYKQIKEEHDSLKNEEASLDLLVKRSELAGQVLLILWLISLIKNNKTDEDTV